QGEPGPRTAEERGPVLRQRHCAPRARSGVAAAAGSRRLQRARRSGSGRQREPLQAGPGRVQQGASGHARAPLPRHDAGGARQYEQGAGRPERRQQPPLSAARPVAEAVAAGGCATGGRRRRLARGRTAARSVRHARPGPRARDAAQPRTRRQPMKTAMPIVAFIVAALLVLSQSIYTVDQRQYAIKFQLGEFIDAKTEAGLYFKVPLLQNIKFYDRRILTLDAPRPDRITTSEKTPLNVDFIAYWRIIDVRRFYQSVTGDEELAKQRLAQTIRFNLAQEINKRTIHEAISAERDKIMATTRARADADAKQIGVEIVEVRLRRAEL